MCFFLVFFPMVVLFCQCSMPIYLYCFIFRLCLRTVWPMLYASFFIFFSFLLCLCLGLCQYSIPLIYIFSFLLCLWLGFTNDLCLPYLYFFLFYVSFAHFCQCAIPLFYIFLVFYDCGSVLPTSVALLCQRSMFLWRY